VPVDAQQKNAQACAAKLKRGHPEVAPQAISVPRSQRCDGTVIRRFVVGGLVPGRSDEPEQRAPWVLAREAAVDHGGIDVEDGVPQLEVDIVEPFLGEGFAESQTATTLLPNYAVRGRTGWYSDAGASAF